MSDQRKAVVVGISGCSSSGKTTLARALRDIFPNTWILHEDDFYKPEEHLPLKDDLVDWDCAEALDVPAMSRALSYIRQNASFPPELESKEDQNSIGPSPLPDNLIPSLRSAASNRLDRLGQLPKIFLLDGFLLYPPSVAPVGSQLDLKLFLRTDYAAAKGRREARDGYVTLEGFWTDPPGYVDKIVWPNYVKEHSWMFKGGDVEGEYDEEALAGAGIKVTKKKGGGVAAIVKWAVDVILDELEKHS